jgi:hypothetical protein|tara:strand:- start:2042 stop:2266 length:225 start_codon:yes stop_codon:yes gene_type:complete
MKFKQYKKDGSADIIFSFRERIIILLKGKLHFSSANLKHVGNWLVKIVSDWHAHFSSETKKQKTNVDQDEIKSS